MARTQKVSGRIDRLVADGDLPLLHRLEQGTLDLGRGAVDLVGEQDAGDDRPGPDVERAGRGPVDLGPGQVGREQVGGELDAAEGEVERPGQGADGPGLGQPGDPLDQDVAPRQQGDDQALEQGALADDGGLEPVDQLAKASARVGAGARIVDGHQSPIPAMRRPGRDDRAGGSLEARGFAVGGRTRGYEGLRRRSIIFFRISLAASLVSL